ncbi:MAG: ATP-binding protein [Eubacterium sp.]|nr:ATP-binding protein [Eubacterium sp.]
MMSTMSLLYYQVLATLLLLASTLQLYLLVYAVSVKIGKWFWAVFVPLFAVTLCSLLLMIGGLHGYYFRLPLPPAEQSLLAQIPTAAVVILTAVLTAATVLLAVRVRRVSNEALTPNAILEGLDMLPDGICFSTEDGLALLVNTKMQNICQEALGEPLMDTVSVLEKIRAGKLRDGCNLTTLGGETFLHLSDGSVWSFYLGSLQVNDKKINEMIAYEVTEQYTKSRELDIRNRHLQEVNRQLKAYDRNMDEMIREREILAAKVKLHDDVGRSLLALRAYLSQPSADREALVALWQFTVSVLKREAVSNDSEDRLETLYKAAKAVDVTLRIDGEIPQEPRLNRLVAQAINECLTNTVKHADGSELNVRLTEQDGIIVVELTNNGRQPKKPIKEKGGLRNLRTSVELYGGMMEVIAQPRFLLRIKLRK